MSWTGRPDNQPCCGDSPGSVKDEEIVARLLHSNIRVPEKAAFKRDELVWDFKTGGFENACGNADGLSLDRCSALDDEAIRHRADIQAKKKDGRRSEGAVVALVDTLRAIPPASPGGHRPVYVYDDPRDGNDEHAVLRVSQEIGRPAFDWVRSEIMKAFSRRLEP